MALVEAGLYGVMAYVIFQPTQEIGIRMALGAQPGRIFRSMFGNAFRLIGIGLVTGGLASIAMNRVIAGQIWTSRASDPFGFFVAAGLVAILGGVACFRPAIRATRIDPVRALRQS